MTGILHWPLLCPGEMLGAVNQHPQSSASSLLAKVQRLFNRDLALENGFLRQENRILRNKLGARVPLNRSRYHATSPFFISDAMFLEHD